VGRGVGCVGFLAFGTLVLFVDVGDGDGVLGHVEDARNLGN